MGPKRSESTLYALSSFNCCDLRADRIHYNNRIHPNLLHEAGLDGISVNKGALAPVLIINSDSVIHPITHLIAVYSYL